MVPRNRPTIGLLYAQVGEHIDLIRKLQHPSVVAVVSVSESLLRTAPASWLGPLGCDIRLAKSYPMEKPGSAWAVRM